MAASASHSASYWAQQLYACLQQMAAHQTNAVLLTLADVDAVETGRRYPDQGLTFADKRWRAFYHCHESATQYQHEHGHYHIFTDVGDDDWAHVAGLSVDMSGQPIHWFAVNRWVTDGPWLERTRFLQQVQAPAENEQDSLPGQWLFALLQFYQAELSDLLRLRDERLESYTHQRELAAVLQDRGIYTLAAKKIELRAMLEKHLLQ
jgi:hypothetical protein